MTAKPQQLCVCVCDHACVSVAAASPSLLSGGMCLSFHAGCHPEVSKGSRPAFKSLHKAPTVSPGGLRLREKKNKKTSINMIFNDRVVFQPAGGWIQRILHDSCGLRLGISAARHGERWQQGCKSLRCTSERMQCGHTSFALAQNWSASSRHTLTAFHLLNTARLL